MTFRARFFAFWFGVMVVVGQNERVRAELILDDFDDPAQVVSPEMFKASIVTANVGVLGASRTLEIDGASVNPAASLDTNISQTSRFSATLTALDVTNMLTPILAFEFRYAFEPADVSDSGANNAIFFDFYSIEGTRTPIFLRALVYDHSPITYEARITDLPLVSGPFSVVMPFSSFTLRGGGLGVPDVTTIEGMDFDFFFLGGSDPVQWTAQLERVRIGRIPEPQSGLLAILGLAAAVAARRWRPLSPQHEGELRWRRHAQLTGCSSR